ncbi:trehalose 6-phosphate synthase [Hydrocarboniphaga daqingensis]|uniref:Trehalose-6-phosphate synthase n=1 Tax=Hydrocarboniphaga daqingensis TaxID=490188 RepID=A0A1M5JTI5_9GAMM|nr:alpha,alpha-trehalose-phosphate synthase (UDP-forming) [Hydrocarboniphaga daqingensis]SHG43293.1 trehalose 6-phosphate synthase [Hydrocarboniphaga daqingensis]
MSPRLVAVSNRISSVRGAPLAGGLAVALVDALREKRGLWFGWSGKTADQSTDTANVSQEGDVTLATVDLSQEDHDAYYSGFANRCLWPLFHFRLDLTGYDRAHFEAYQRVNRRFAGALSPLLRDDDLIWVHDYHLFPLGSELRRLGVTQRLGFFLHIPFPPRELLTTLPQHRSLVRSLFDYDLVGFQIEDDVKRLASYVEQDLGGTVGDGWMEAFGRRLNIRAFPVGIDTARYHDFAFSSHGQREYLRLREFLRDRDQIIGVDRLDYSKGLVRRMNAYELLLESQAAAHGRITYLQIAPISRGEVAAYQDFRRELEQHAANINGRFGQVDWVPIRYVNEAIPRRRLAGLYRASRVGLVTPMRDGMNLVAKEYVAAQDEKDPGVLVLSRFAGAAQQMRDALLVNPYDTEEVAGALEQARTMPLDERRNRHHKLMEGLLRDDVSDWRRRFLEALG